MTDPLIGKVFAGCTITEKLGQGGMGTVYKANHAALAKIVCVKILSPELARDQRNVEFFLREARSAARLEHPNIVHVYNFGQENDAHFIVMSYIEGKSLQDIVHERGPLPVAEATELIAGVLDGLAHAHANTIIHRDIKPSNILVDKTGKPYIADFGLARSLSEEKQLTMAGEMIGTAYFMSPEQCLAKTVDNRADLYSTGATFFYILTGKYPFDGKTSVEVIHKHLSDPVPNPMLANPDMPLWASRVIERLMRKKPEDRYQKAEDVATELRKYNSGELKIGMPGSTETTFDLPELTERMMTTKPPPPPGAKPQAEAPKPTPKPSFADPRRSSFPVPGPRRGGAAPKFFGHLAASSAAALLLLFSGASGKAAGSLSAPFATNPGAASGLALLGAALLALAVRLKPRKFTLLHALFAVGSAAACYAAGALLQAPAGLDAVSKIIAAFSAASQLLMTREALPLYAVCLYLLAAKIVQRHNWPLKALAALCFAASAGLVFAYFRVGVEGGPDSLWLAIAGGLAAAGLAAALTQNQFSVFFNPQLLFLAANMSVFAMLSGPHVEQLTAGKAAVASEQAALANAKNHEDYRRAMQAAQAEVAYDVDGRPIERRLQPPEEVHPTERSVLQAQARAEYFDSVALELKITLAGAPGLLLLGLFLALMANITFLEELAAAAKETDLY